MLHDSCSMTVCCVLHKFNHRDERWVLNLVMHMFAYIFFSFEDVELYNWFVPAHVHVSVWLLLGYPPSALSDDNDRLRFHPLAFVHGSFERRAVG